MLALVSATDILRKTIEVMKRSSLNHISGKAYEDEVDRLYFIQEAILKELYQLHVEPFFADKKILDKKTFVLDIVRKYDNTLASCLIMFLTDETIAGVYFF